LFSQLPLAQRVTRCRSQVTPMVTPLHNQVRRNSIVPVLAQIQMPDRTTRTSHEAGTHAAACLDSTLEQARDQNRVAVSSATDGSPGCEITWWGTHQTTAIQTCRMSSSSHLVDPSCSHNGISQTVLAPTLCSVDTDCIFCFQGKALFMEYALTS